MKSNGIDYRLQLHNYSVDGVVTEIRETRTSESDLIRYRNLTFKFFDAKQLCVAQVTFSTDSERINLYRLAVRFVKRLKYR